MTRFVPSVGCPALALALAACGTSTSTTDLKVVPTDMAVTIKDMAVKPADMVPPVDMFFVPPTLTIPSSCVAATVTAATLYSTIISPKCLNATCHNGTVPPTMLGSATVFRNAVLNIPPDFPRYAGLVYAKANDPNNSFILYKVNGEHAKIPSGGERMPHDGPPYLSATDQCLLINWIRSGATP